MGLWMKWEELCQKNVDHYNDHPQRHAGYLKLGIAAGMLGMLGIGVIAQKIAEDDLEWRKRAIRNRIR